MEIVVQEGIEELVVIEELLEDPELTELEKCDALAPLYHIEGIGLHIGIQRNTAISVLSGVCAPDLGGREGRVRGGGGTCQDRAKNHPLRRLRFLGRRP